MFFQEPHRLRLRKFNSKLTLFLLLFIITVHRIYGNQGGGGMGTVSESDQSGERWNAAHLGTRSLVQNRTIYGAIIMSSTSSSVSTHGFPPSSSSLNSSTPIPSLNGKTDILTLRTQHARNLIREMPFPVMEWPSVFTDSCPLLVHRHRTERGVALAHYSIWLDFTYFDLEVIQAIRKGEVNGMYTSKSRSYSSGLFSAAENGTLYKNGAPFLEDDILVVLEDDADIAIIDFNTTIIEELSSMTTDLLYLGWCEGRLAKPVPLCTQAYAVTRRGASKIMKYYEPCGKAVDEQFVIMVKNNWITYRRAHTWSYKNRYNSNYPRAHDSTFGIFHQKKHALASLNGH